jgi:hypothetical protein
MGGQLRRELAEALDRLIDEFLRALHAVVLVATSDRDLEPQVALGDDVLAVVLAGVTLERVVDRQRQDE